MSVHADFFFWKGLKGLHLKNKLFYNMNVLFSARAARNLYLNMQPTARYL